MNEAVNEAVAAPRRTLVYGLGRSGRAVVRHLHRLGWPGAWWDEAPNPEDGARAVALGYPRVTALEPGAYSLAVAAPGVPIDHPDLGRLRAAGAEVIGEAELCYRTVPTPLLGVTGTAGKTSTTALLAFLLRGQGLNALEGGNIDPPLLEVAPRAEVAVVELSSFQLERVVRFRPAVAVITNLGVDHLDRHRTLGAYHGAKLRIAANLGPEDRLIVPAGLVPAGLDLSPPLPGTVRVIEVAQEGPVRDLAGEPLLELSALPAGQHPQNARLAAAAALAYLERLGRAADRPALRASLAGFPGVAGRFETVGTVRGTRFIEDSIATRTLAVLAALEAAPGPVAWIVGGQDKGADLEPLLSVVRRKVRVILAVGRDGPRLASFFSPVPVEVITEPDGAVALELAAERGLELARGGSVLLAPLGTSFDQFSDYKARGAAFRRAVQGLAARADGASPEVKA